MPGEGAGNALAVLSDRALQLTPGPRESAVSIVDVARRAGVSVSTVSRSLRGASNVSAATRERVRRAADELAYVPSPAASRLASGRTGTIGVLVPFTKRWFFAEVLAGAEGPFREGGYDLLLYNVGDLRSRSAFFGDLPLRRRVDAVLSIASSLSDHERESLTGLGVPVVSVGQRCAGLSGVGVDDEGGAEMAMRHLLLLAHRDIAMISGRPDDPLGRATTGARLAGFRKAITEAGIEERGDQVVAEPWGVAGGARAMERLLARRTLPTAVFAESDEMALGALHVLGRAGLNVPGQVSLIGFDDHEMATTADLTTIAQPVREQGELAARMLLEVLGGSASSGFDVVLPTQLVVRRSTGPPRTA